MDALTILALIILAVLIGGFVIVFNLLKKKPEGEGSGLVLLQQQMQELARTLDTRVAESAKQMQESSHRPFTESSRLIKEITEEVTSVKEIGRPPQSFAEQLKNLQDI